MIWKSIGNDRRGPTDLHLILLRVMRNVQEAYRHQHVKIFG